jgi:DNA-binding Lrp family transcriptional regulator
MCHLLCEFSRRLEAAGLADANGYELPMTQEQLADALGITPVHVNRILRELDREELVVRNKRFVRVPNWEELRRAGGFNELYLHLNQVVPIAPEIAAQPT